MMPLQPGSIYVQPLQKQVAGLDHLVSQLGTALHNALVNRRPVRQDFIDAWTSWRVQWRAAIQKPLTPDRVTRLTKAVNEWARMFRGQGIELSTVSAGSFIMTPSAIAAEVEKVKTVINALNKDIEAAMSAPVGSSRRIAGDKIRGIWRPFFDEFTAWWQAGPSNLWGATADKADEYERRARELAREFIMKGGSSEAAAVAEADLKGGTPPPPPKNPQIDKTLTAIEVVAGAAAFITLVSLIRQALPPRAA